MAPDESSLTFLLKLFHFFAFLSTINSFNLDTHIPIIKSAPIPETHFGYSVALHRTKPADADGSIPFSAQDNVLLVGAPASNIKQDRGEGALYKCPMTSYQTDCVKVVVDPYAADGPSDFDEKFDQWLGVTVSSQGPGQKVMACAHRYKLIGRTYKWGIGMCYVMTSTLEQDAVQEPCAGQPYDDGHEEFGFCQAGTSAQFTQDDNVVIGTPGPYYWRGGIFKITSSSDLNVDKFWYHSTMTERVGSTQVPPVKINSYLGYSVASGYLLNNEMTYVSGAPRSNDTGQVVMFLLDKTTRSLHYLPEHILTGDKFGSSFGYSLCVVDVNADKRMDLIVGAPFYHDKNVGGQIYVFLNSPQGITRNTIPIKIPSRQMSEADCKKFNCENARFGSSLADLGDIDKDGYPDVAVGAPYEGKGVVYIFNGGPLGLQRRASQRIAAEDVVGLKSPDSFGHSLSANLDMDGNGYPDLLVGSFQSETVTLLRARPVVRIYSEIEKIPSEINTEDKNCPDGRSLCFKLRLCFKFTAEPRNKFSGEIAVLYKIEAEKYEGGNVFSRILFNNAKDPLRRYIVQGGLTLFDQASNTMKCVEVEGIIDPSTKDLLNPIHFKVTYGLEEKVPPPTEPGQALPNIDIYPAFNKMDAEKIVVLDFVKNCAEDKICHCDLVVEGFPEGLEPDPEIPGNYNMILGEPFVKLNFTITNKNEDAHAAEFYMTIPKGISIKKQDNVVCAQIDGVLQCNVGNPLTQLTSRHFSVEVFTHSISMTDNVVFNLTVNTTSVELVPSDNQRTITITPIIKTNIQLRGLATPEQVFYGGEIRGEQAMRNEEEIGTELTHKYEVINNGNGRAVGVSVDINWPYEVGDAGDASGKYLLYMTRVPEITDAEGRCVIDPARVNPLNVKLTDQTVQEGREAAYNVAPDNRFTKRGLRYRRAVTETEEVVMRGGKRAYAVKLNCERKTAKCFTFHCELNEIRAYQRATITIRARLWNSTLVEDYPYVDTVEISSSAQVKLDPRYRIVQDTSDDRATAKTSAFPDVKAAEGGTVPLWVILVAVACGLFILLILILLLWCFGFFRRNKAPTDDRYLHKATVKKHKSSEDW